ncbi:MAG: IS1634 family transposase [Candidatus Dadabacteria bacterium]|nr:IS1634 family transposase [Candidatus Dadabacteria bacterium]
MSLHVDTIPNRKSRPAILLREAWREGDRIIKKTLCNLTHLPPHIVDGIRAMLKGGVVYKDIKEAFPIKRSLPHGHVAAVYGTAKNLGLDLMLHKKRSRERDIAVGAIVTIVLSPASKLATSRMLSSETATTSVGCILGLGEVTGNEVLSVLDWLMKRKPWIEKVLAKRHLSERTMVLYDVTSSYFEGETCSVSAFGHSRDKRGNNKQIVFGLLCSKYGCPVAVEVFPGNTADPMTVGAQIEKIKERFSIRRVALVGDRGMITTARIRKELEPGGIDWISALKTTDIRNLLKKPKEGNPPLNLEYVEEDKVGEIRSDLYPGERLMVCLNPRLREERRQKREDLLLATESILEEIKRLVRNGSLAGAQEINRRVGREANREKVEKHFDITVTDSDISWERKEGKISKEAALDGVYIVRTSLGEGDIGADEAVYAYKSLSMVERAFRSMKTTSLQVRPMYVYSEGHVRGYVFLCMLAYYVEWHLRRSLSPLMFEDDYREEKRSSPVEQAEVSESAKRKYRTKKTEERFSVHSLRTLMEDLGTLSLNEVTPPGSPEHRLHICAESTALQQRAFELLDVEPGRFVPSTATG